MSQKRLFMYRRLLLCLLIASVPAHAASPRDLPNYEFHATMDKKNVEIHFDEGMVGSMINDEELSGLEGVTKDFTASNVPAFIVFDESVTEQRLLQLVNFQGRLKGVVQCKRVRVGSTPMSPAVKVGVVGEHCIIKSINH